MARINSILDEESWKRSFGALLATVATEQNISPSAIGERLDRLSTSTRKGRPRARISDWWRYVNEGRIPTEGQVELLAEALRIPPQVLRVCAGYVDDIFECTYAIALGKAPKQWDFPIEPIKAAMALLFSLFPSEDRMNIGRRGSLFFWMHGSIIRSNLTTEEGFLTGADWNAIWLYPVRDPEHLIAHHENPDDQNVTWVWTGEPRKEPWTWYSMRALLQVDLASDVASTILRSDRVRIPKDHPLAEAQRTLHRKVLPLTMRMGQSAEIIHHWADGFSEELAAEVREHLNPWYERTISDDAARWVRGEAIKPRASKPDEPRAIAFRRYEWEKGGRPHDFWR